MSLMSKEWNDNERARINNRIEEYERSILTMAKNISDCVIIIERYKTQLDDIGEDRE